ncbi:MAG: hypothetical protein GY847_29040 [Proteobacteria bacterium]|nr:hypothetical protein [Pseudomonadota bacterium]
MTKTNFKEQLEYGEIGEGLIADYLASCGVAVLPLYQFENKTGAPFLAEKIDNRLYKRVLPDLTCWNNGKSFFAEVKRKTEWVRFTGSLETGFNHHSYLEYCAVRKKTKCDIWLFFLHEVEEPTGLFVGKMRDLEPNMRIWDGKRPNGKKFGKAEVFFRHTDLTRRDDFVL